MKIGVLTAGIIAIVAIFAVGPAFAADDSFDLGEFGREQYTLYGYVLDYFTVSAEDSGNVLYVRLKGDWSPTADLAFHSEVKMEHLSGNQEPGSLFGAPNEETNPKVEIDHLWGMGSWDKIDLQFGKIPIAWGTGYAFNPTMKTHTVSFLTDIAEETPGTLAIVPSFAIDDTLAVEGYLAFQDKGREANPDDGETWRNLPYGIKVRGIAGNFDVSGSWIREVTYDGEFYHREYYVGGDFVGAVGDFGVYGEMALNVPRGNDGTAFSFSGHRVDDLVEACLGLDYVFVEADVTARLEYYHQGIGETDPSRYSLEKILFAKQFLQAEDYLVVRLDKPFLDYYNASISTLTNLNDGSIALLPEVTYDVSGNLQIAAGTRLFMGRDQTEFRGEYELAGTTIDVTEPALYVKVKLSF